MKRWHLYMIRAADGRLYTGIATDVARRLEEHGKARGARSLRGRGPLELVLEREVGSQGLALQLEYRIKQLRRSEKEQLLSRAPSTAALVERFAIGTVVDRENP